MANAGWLSAVFAVVMTTIVGLLCMNILQWMNTPEDIIQGAYDYIFVIFLGIPVTYLYNMLAASSEVWATARHRSTSCSCPPS